MREIRLYGSEGGGPNSIGPPFVAEAILPALLDHRHQRRVGGYSLGVAESADVSQLAEDHLGRHGAHPPGRS